MTIYTIIVHYKNQRDTITCLKSVLKLSDRKATIKVLIIDNDPKRRIKKRVNSTFFKKRNIQFFENEKNLGYAKAVNIGINQALKKKAGYVLILNNDVVVPSNLVNKLLERKVDISGPIIKFKSFSGKWVYDYGGKINWWTGRTKHIEKSSTITHQPSVIDYISGCCMLVAREVFEKVGLLDEDYFFYFEDVDLCVRARRGGFAVVVNQDVVVTHKLSGSIGRWTKKAIFYNIGSNFKFISKRLGWRKPIGYGYLVLLTGKIVMDRIFKNGI